MTKLHWFLLRIFVGLLFGLVRMGVASDEWTKQDYILEGTWLGIHALDWGTTLDITASNEKYKELNPIFGNHPNRDMVNLLMATGTVAHIFITDFLPRKYNLWGWEMRPRELWQSITIGMSGGCVINNFAIGLRRNF